MQVKSFITDISSRIYIFCDHCTFVETFSFLITKNAKDLIDRRKEKKEKRMENRNYEIADLFVFLVSRYTRS